MTKLTVIAGGRSSNQQFEELIRPHYGALYGLAYRLTGSAHDAEDLAQETCVRAFRRLHQLASYESPKTWLLCVLKRLYIDQTRRYERRHARSLEEVADDSLVAEASDPAELADAAIGRRRLARAWPKLNKQQRLILALHDIEGYSLSELMQITGLKEGTLKSKLHRARVKLGLLMRDEEVAAIQVGEGA